jgi:hypothetical protein
MPVVDPRIAGKPVPRISKERMERECVARVKNVEALDVAFLDQRIPRYERHIINMVGMGVTENAALKPNVKESAVGFSVTYVRAKTSKGAALQYASFHNGSKCSRGWVSPSRRRHAAISAETASRL